MFKQRSGSQLSTILGPDSEFKVKIKLLGGRFIDTKQALIYSVENCSFTLQI